MTAVPDPPGGPTRRDEGGAPVRSPTVPGPRGPAWRPVNQILTRPSWLDRPAVSAVQDVAAPILLAIAAVLAMVLLCAVAGIVLWSLLPAAFDG